ncbi:hypothetical protein SAMN05192580_0455 [Sphingomonas jatrophae]|uniref:GDSL-like Lipase/Acylhydrolase family protein n=2 Tax=Sphingomonas jatrophae TaxID=1166337 RepID=A0A1I6JL81_9SPHN|nr:hypothetical protein SAMN05192580_0455 [Sphingomonas jatrophae]
MRRLAHIGAGLAILAQLALGTPALAQSARDAAGLASTALSAPTQSKHFARTGGFSIVSRVKADFGAGLGATATGGTFGMTQRIAHTNLTGCELTSVAPLFSHWAPAAGVESNTSQDLMIKVAIEPKGTVTDQATNPPLYVQGRGLEVFTLSRRGSLIVDEVPVSVAAGATFYERTGVTTATAASGTIPRSQIARGGTAMWGENTGEGANANDSVLFNNVTNNTVAGYTSSLMLGRCVSGKIAPSIIGIGDSISVGSHDYIPNGLGWVARALAGWPGGQLGIAGEKERDTLTARGFMARMPIARFATAILDEYGTNDINAADSLATVKASILASALRFQRQGQAFIKATILPYTTSTNGWFDVAGQTVTGNEAVRAAVNSWLRDTSANGFVAQANAQVASIPSAGRAYVVDPAAGVEVDASGALTLNGGFWMAAPGGILDSGTATGGSTSSVISTAKAYGVNALRGYVVHTTGGTAAGQICVVAYNTATVITCSNSMPLSPDATTTFRIYRGLAVDGLHPATEGHARAAAAAKPAIDKIMSLPIGFNLDMPRLPANDNEAERLAA